MKRVMAVRIAEPCDGLEVVEVEEPYPKRGEILIEMKARPIQPADLLIVRDRHIVKPTLPDPVGIEGIGKVIALGEDVQQPVVGSLVALPFGGTWSERVVLPASAVLMLPSNCDLYQGSMFALNPVTALGLLDGLREGEWLIHNAANSSLGKLITKLAVYRGIPNISVVRRKGMEDELQALGANHVLVDGDDLAKRVLDITNSKGVKRALDAVSGRATGRLHDATAEGGEVICYGLLGSDDVILPSARVIFRNVTIRGYSRLRALQALGVEGRRVLEKDLFDYFSKGVFYTPVLAKYVLEDVKEAVVKAEEVGSQGKVLLVSPELLD